MCKCLLKRKLLRESKHQDASQSGLVLKALGNDEFRNLKYDSAVEYYIQCITMLTQNLGSDTL